MKGIKNIDSSSGCAITSRLLLFMGLMVVGLISRL